MIATTPIAITTGQAAAMTPARFQATTDGGCRPIGAANASCRTAT